MKKFIIALFGILVTTGAICTPGNYAEPKNESIYSDIWKVSGTYNTSIYQQNLYSYLYAQMCYQTEAEGKCEVKKGDGTYNDEKAVVLYIATKIYKNGAKFCAVQVQPGNSNGQQWVWLDYYYKSALYPCYTYCESGYDPENNCEKFTETSDKDCDISYEFPFTTHEIIGSGGRTNNGRFTEDMDVFSFANEKGWGESSQPAGNQFTKHRVLGILSETKDKKGIVVAPFEITGRRGLVALFGNGIESWIYDVTTNNKTTTLCAHGYELKQGQCVLTPKCRQEQNDIQDNQIDWCKGYDYYDSKEHQSHILKPKKFTSILFGLDTTKECKYYRCKQSNYGWKENTNHKCIECEINNKSGILSNGECKTCKTGEIFDKNAQNGCKAATQYKQKEMREGTDPNENKRCWMKTDPDEFANCVTGQ